MFMELGPRTGIKGPDTEAEVAAVARIQDILGPDLGAGHQTAAAQGVHLGFGLLYAAHSYFLHELLLLMTHLAWVKLPDVIIQSTFLEVH
jgi:hypothetical protein